MTNKLLKNNKYIVEMKNISKSFSFGKIIANKNVNLKIKNNEIHAICGENGAGKTTLMSILFGLLSPDKGQIFLDGKLINEKKSWSMLKTTIGMVHQHFKLVQSFTVFDNIILGVETTKFGFILKNAARKKIENICQQYNFKLDLDAKVSTISISDQQKVEIIKLLYYDAKILIFDEPTSILSDNEIKSFLKMLKHLKKAGKTIIFITHKMDEIKEIADQITILCKGQSMGTFEAKSIKKNKLIKLMVGTNITTKINKISYKKNTNPILTIKHLFANKINDKKIKAINDLNFSIYPGEIVGLAGIEGNGQSELALILTGIQKAISGSINFQYDHNKLIDIVNLTPKIISNLGISHVPENRHKYGCILDESVEYNLVLNQLDNKMFNKWGFLQTKAINLNAIKLCTKFNILGANHGKSLMRSLSSGNQQKVVIAREISKKHSLIIMVQPTQGLDVKAVNIIHKYILQEAKDGKAVLLISYEIDEILKIANRILVMSNGKILYDQLKNKTNRNVIGKYLAQ